MRACEWAYCFCVRRRAHQPGLRRALRASPAHGAGTGKRPVHSIAGTAILDAPPPYAESRRLKNDGLDQIAWNSITSGAASHARTGPLASPGRRQAGRPGGQRSAPGSPEPSGLPASLFLAEKCSPGRTRKAPLACAGRATKNPAPWSAGPGVISGEPPTYIGLRAAGVVMAEATKPSSFAWSRLSRRGRHLTAEGLVQALFGLPVRRAHGGFRHSDKPPFALSIEQKKSPTWRGVVSSWR